MSWQETVQVLGVSRKHKHLCGQQVSIVQNAERAVTSASDRCWTFLAFQRPQSVIDLIIMARTPQPASLLYSTYLLATQQFAGDNWPSTMVPSPPHVLHHQTDAQAHSAPCAVFSYNKGSIALLVSPVMCHAIAQVVVRAMGCFIGGVLLFRYAHL